MNYRIIVLSCLSFNCFLAAKNINLKQEDNTKHEIESIIHCASEFENFNPQKPENTLKDFEKKYRSRFEKKLPRSRALDAAAILQKDAQQQSDLSPSERCEKIKTAQFLEAYAHEKNKGWRERHPNWNSAASTIVGGVVSVGLLVAILADK